MRRRFLGGDRLSKNERKSAPAAAGFGSRDSPMRSFALENDTCPCRTGARAGEVGGEDLRGLVRRTGLEEVPQTAPDRGDEDAADVDGVASLRLARLPYVRLTLGVFEASSSASIEAAALPRVRPELHAETAHVSEAFRGPVQ